MNASHGLIHGVAAAAHPMDPLSGDEIVAAANILLNARAAQPGAIFQAVDLLATRPLLSLSIATETDGTGAPLLAGLRQTRVAGPQRLIDRNDGAAG